MIRCDYPDSEFEGSLDLEDRTILYDVLPLIMAGTRISTITADTIPHILARADVVCAELLQQLADRANDLFDGPGNTPRYLRRFLGVKAEGVVTLPTAQFVRGISQHLPAMTRVEAHAVDVLSEKDLERVASGL